MNNSPLQDVKWPDSLEGEMNVHRASLEYVQYYKAIRRRLAKPYVPEYIVPYVPGVEPYVPENLGSPPYSEDDEACSWEADLLEQAGGTSVSKRSKLG